MVGETIGKYRILESIGRGGVGTVYRAVDLKTDREVAIKALNTATVDPVQVRRFETEARALSRVDHQGITKVLELVERGNDRLMVMELLHGETLDHVVRQQGTLSFVRAAALIVQALAALDEAHRAGVVHRDIKPGNLLLTNTGRLKVLDFGVALVAGADRVTEAGMLVGTPGYMAPEQVTGAPVDARTDLYSVGLVFYFLVTGKLPFAGKTPALIADARVTGVPQPLREHRHDAPEWVERVLDRALFRHPDGRYQSAAEFREELEAGIRNHRVTGSGVVIAPEAETVAMPIPEFASRPNTKPSAERQAPRAKQAAGAGPMLVVVFILSAVIALLLLIR